MVSPNKKLMRTMILEGMDLGSIEEPCTNQEPQMRRNEVPAEEEEPLLWKFSRPKRNDAVRREETKRKKPPRPIQRLMEKGCTNVDQFVFSPGNLMKNLSKRIYINRC